MVKRKKNFWQKLNFKWKVSIVYTLIFLSPILIPILFRDLNLVDGSSPLWDNFYGILFYPTMQIVQFMASYCTGGFECLGTAIMYFILLGPLITLAVGYFIGYILEVLMIK